LRLAGLITQRQELLKMDQELQAQLDRTGANVAKLEGAIGQSGGGMVSIDGTAVNPIEASNKKTISGAGKSAKTAIPELSKYADVMARIKSEFGSAVPVGQTYRDTLAQLDALYRSGAINQKQYEDATAAVERQFQGATSAADGLRSQASQTFASIITGADDASDAVANLLSNLAGQFANAAFGGLFKSVPAFDALGGLLSFDGGGQTPSGPRSGGLDGKGGFLSVMHPDESVYDHKKGQAPRGGGGGGGPREINVNVSGARGNQEVTEMVQRGVQQGLQEYDRSVLPSSVQKINNDPRRIK
jgi:hypothetical protein